jgi:hypothetical protein
MSVTALAVAFGVVVARLALSVKMERAVKDKSRKHRENKLKAERFGDKVNAPVADKHGEHLVRGGKQYGKESSRGYNSARVEICRAARNAALGYYTECAAEKRTYPFRAADARKSLVPCVMLQRFHSKICQEQDRKHQGKLPKAMEQNVKYIVKYFHFFSLIFEPVEQILQNYLRRERVDDVFALFTARVGLVEIP